ncbi:MAG: VCBS repeat-containing protein [Planctomycetes bacterium]|nr:VCBS repeat-containing protein [Planctomycetota bacterium]
MRTGLPILAGWLGLTTLAQGQRFGFTHQMVPAEGEPATDVAIGDVDGDGDLDVLVTNEYFRQSQLLLNDGTGAFTDSSATNLPVLLGSAEAVELGDVDADGDLDAFLGIVAGQDRLYLNDGLGFFTDVTAGSLPATIDWTMAVALGDVDGDGDLDAYLGNTAAYPGGQNRLYLNGGAGVFADATATNLPAVPTYTEAVALGDVDGDGDLDAFVGCFETGGSGNLERLFLNGGTGIFTESSYPNLPSQFSSMPVRSVAFGDVDGDGDLDAILGNGPGGGGGAQSRLYRNDGTGVFTDVTASGLPPLLFDTRAVELGDVDGDGDLDALLGNWVQESRLYLNGGTGVFADLSASNLPGFQESTRAVAIGDVDGDGDLDALFGNFGQDRLCLNDGTAAFSDVSASGLPSLFDGVRDVALGDVDADGDLDAWVATAGLFPGPLQPAPDRLYLNDGTGAYADATATSLPALLDLTEAVALGDVDGDGDLDAFLGNTASDTDPFPGDQNRLYLNSGTGVFTDATATNVPAVLDHTHAVALGDVDGDGDLDAFVGNHSSGVGGFERLHLNNGSGVFSDATTTNLPFTVNATEAVALGDVDGDGDLDAFVGNDGDSPLGQQNRLYLNAGTGVFTDATSTHLPALFDPTQDVALGDLDGDGDLDALVGNSSLTGGSGQDRLLLNDGTGVFTDFTTTSLPARNERTNAVVLGDFDEDGDLDVLLVDLGQDRLYSNTGAGIFTDVTGYDLPSLLDGGDAVALGDLDGDGDLDAFVGNSSHPSRLYVNLTRQLAWRGIPRAGKPLTFELRGTANGLWLLGVSLASASLPLPPLGTLRLDPSTLSVVASGSLDPQGRTTVSYLVPSNPVFVGTSLYWQAVVGPPLRFTNLEVTTVTNL